MLTVCYDFKVNFSNNYYRDLGFIISKAYLLN